MPVTTVAEGAPNSMRAWVVEKAGDFAAIEQKRVEIPAPGAGQVRIKVVSACTNPVDFKHASFEGLSAFPAVFGCDGAGTVDAVGEGVTAFKAGDRVHYFGNVFDVFGTFAEYAVADAQILAPIPEGMDFDTAAVTPCALWTAYEALFDRMRVKAGDTVLVSAGAGGVGHLAVQLAKNAGARVIATASGDNVATLRAAGYEVVDYRNEDVVEGVKKLTDGKGADAFLDCIPCDDSAKILDAVRFAGQYTQIASAVAAAPGGGSFFNGLTAHHVFTPGNLVRPDQAARWVAIGAAADALVVSGAVKVNVSKTYDFDGVKDALVAQASGRTRGKQLIKIAA